MEKDSSVADLSNGLIYVIAPYSPAGSSSTNLGAARKLETFIGIFARLGHRILLINTAHNVNRFAWFSKSTICVADASLEMLCPPTVPIRSIGKLFNLFAIGATIRRAVKVGPPSLVWVYNGYAFECLAVDLIKRRWDIPALLEFEDWHFARTRIWSLKPRLDHFLWRRSVKLFAGAFCVNKYLYREIEARGIPAFLLPGLVAKGVSALAQSKPPFLDPASAATRVGYFGGLNKEKGCDQLLEAISLQYAAEFLVCGAGPMLGDFRRLERELGGRLKVFSDVSFTDLIELISRCDALVNPHVTSEVFSTGIFPSKVLEGIGSGRLLISTPLPELGMKEIFAGVRFYDGSLKELVNAIGSAKEFYFLHRTDIVAASLAVVSRFGEQAIFDHLRDLTAAFSGDSFKSAEGTRGSSKRCSDPST